MQTITEPVKINGTSLLSGTRRNETRTFTGKITNVNVSVTSFTPVPLVVVLESFINQKTVVQQVYTALNTAGLIGAGGINQPYQSGPDGKSLTFHYWTQAFTAYDIQIDVTHEV
jgi:hypothetical protein